MAIVDGEGRASCGELRLPGGDWAWQLWVVSSTPRVCTPCQTTRVINPSGKYGWCSRMNVHVHGSSQDSMMLEKSLATVENLSRKVGCPVQIPAALPLVPRVRVSVPCVL